MNLCACMVPGQFKTNYFKFNSNLLLPRVKVEYGRDLGHMSIYFWEIQPIGYEESNFDPGSPIERFMGALILSYCKIWLANGRFLAVKMIRFFTLPNK